MTGAALLFIQAATDSGSAGALPGWAGELDSSAKIVASVVAAVVAFLGIPVAYLQTRKTRAEIYKLELEAAALEQKHVGLDSLPGGHRIEVHDVRDSQIDIQVLADPRFLGPLLVLLDFIVVWVLLTFANYGIGAFLGGLLGDLIIAVIAAVLLVPVLRNALRLRSTLRSAYPAEGAIASRLGEDAQKPPAT